MISVPKMIHLFNIFWFLFLVSNAAIVEVMKGVEQPLSNDLRKIEPLVAQPSSWPSRGEAVFELTAEGVKCECMASSNNHCSGWVKPISLGWYISLGEGSLWLQNQVRQSSLTFVDSLSTVWCLKALSVQISPKFG